MINQVAEAIYSATYVENYLDYVENLPNDVQRHLSRIREIDVEYRGEFHNKNLLFLEIFVYLFSFIRRTSERHRQLLRSVVQLFDK